MLIFVWENCDEIKILWNSEGENEFGFGKYDGLKLPNGILAGNKLGEFHYYIYVGF